MTWNREPRNIATLIRSVNLQGARLCSEGKTACSLSATGKTGWLHVKEGNWTTFPHCIQKLTQKGSKTYMYELKQ